MFTSLKDTDFEILNRLNDYDLLSTCKVSSHFRKLCKDDQFWLNRTVKRFGEVLKGIVEIRKYKQKYRFPTWKAYYIDLINQLELYYQEHKTGWREDWDIIKNKIDENTEKFKCTNVKCIEESLKYDFINLSRVWYNSELRGDEAMTAINILLNDPRFKITPSVIFNSDYKELRIMISKRNNAHTRESVMRMFLREFVDSNVFNIISPFVEKKEIWNILFTKLGHEVNPNTISILLKTLVEKGVSKSDLLEGYENMNLDRSINRKNLEIMKKYIDSMSD